MQSLGEIWLREAHMGTIKEAMLEHRMVSTGANDVLHRRHWTEEIRNSMYQLNDAELCTFLSENQIERERLRVCIQMSEDDTGTAPDESA